MLLGSIVDVINILPCAITIVDDAKITELVVTASDVSAPTLNGLDDANGGTVYILSAFTDALFDMYGPILSNTLPSFLAASMKDVATDYISDQMEDDACPDPDANLTGLIDYCDLFLSEEESIELKGRNTVNFVGTCMTTSIIQCLPSTRKGCRS